MHDHRLDAALIEQFQNEAEQIIAEIGNNHGRVEMFRLEYNNNSGNNWNEDEEFAMSLPHHWVFSLSAYHQAVARQLAQRIYTRAKVNFWEHEQEIRAEELAFYTEEVIFERMWDRRRKNLQECYDNIHTTLRIPQEFPNPIQIQPHEPIQHLLDRFEELPVHVNIIAAVVGHPNFDIRIALPFTRHPRFIGTPNQGPAEQHFLYNQAWERYKELCENLMWKLQRIMFGDVFVQDDQEAYREIIRNARNEWELMMYKWMDKVTPIRETVLMRFADGDFIPRQLEAVWAGGLVQQWGNWEMPPEEEDEAPLPNEEQQELGEPLPEPEDMEEVPEELPIDPDFMDSDSDNDSDNNSSLTD